VKRLLIPASAVAVAAALTTVFATNSNGSRGLDRLTNAGEPVAKVSPAGARALAQLGAIDLRLLGQIHGRQFFRLTVRGSACFASGEADTAGATPTDVYCPHGNFPSASLPVYDDPAVEIQKSEAGVARIVALDGFAADGVVRVDFVRQGDVIASAPVIGNVFSLDIAGIDIAGTRLVARDQAGNIVFSRAYPAPPS